MPASFQPSLQAVTHRPFTANSRNAMNPPTRHARVLAAEAGFTLIEIMVVVMILGLLATLVVANVGDAADTAREKKAQHDVSAIADAVRSYRVTTGKLPDSLDVLAAKDDRGRSQLEHLWKDPWDHAYILRSGDKDGEFEVISRGMDGCENTGDDISSKPRQGD